MPSQPAYPTIVSTQQRREHQPKELSGKAYNFPLPQGKYNHPWSTPMPAGKAKVYDVLYKSVSASLMALTAYGIFELVRVSYYILMNPKAKETVTADASEAVAVSGGPTFASSRQ